MKLTRRTETIVWAATVVTAVLCGAVTLLVPGREDFEDTLMQFRVDFLNEPLGIAITMLVLTNFALAFAVTTPMAKTWLKREAARQHPDLVFMQYFVITLALYEMCAVLGLVYALLQGEEVRAPHSLQLIALPLCLVGLVKFLWVDAPEMRELVTQIRDRPESEDSAPPEIREETPQSSPQ